MIHKHTETQTDGGKNNADIARQSRQARNERTA